MELKMIIKGELPDLNTYTSSLANNRHIGGKVKREATHQIAWETKKFGTRKLPPPYHITFNWYCKNKKKDPDNVIFAKKFILDGLQISGVIPQDTWNTIQGFTDNLFIDKEDPRIEIIIKSLKQNV